MNRHLKIAFIVAPFLAIGGYALVDQYQYSRQREQASMLYPLQADGECRLRPAGGCLLRHPLLTVRLKTADRREDGGLMVLLESDQPLTGGKLGYGRRGGVVPQRSLQPAGDGQRWRVPITAPDLSAAGRLDLRMVLVSDGRVFIAEVPARF
jgi:hypothetical protein